MRFPLCSHHLINSIGACLLGCTAYGQQLTAAETGNYAGINALHLNPSAIADSRWKGMGLSWSTPESFTQLNELALLLPQNAAIRIEIRGHTDNQSDFDLNVKLARDRCQSVMDYLTKKSIQPTRMQSVGRGPLDPVAPNTTEDNRKKNRSVKFVVL